MSKLWTYHCLEGRKPGTFTVPLGRHDDMPLLESSPIDFSYVQTAKREIDAMVKPK